MHLHRHLSLVCALAGCLLAPAAAYGGAYVFAGENNGVDVVTHPQGYRGSGASLDVKVCIVPGSPNAASMEIPLQNAIDHFNQLVPSLYNLRLGADNSLAFNQLDWESTALHEVGHCIGLAHPNLASESGLSAPLNESTKSTEGANNAFDTNPGADGVYGSVDDARGDDENLHWFLSGINNPFGVAAVVDAGNFARNLADLPVGDSFAANADRTVAGLFGVGGTEGVMQQLTYNDEDQRTLVGDEVNTLKFARTGLDRTYGTADDYSVNLTYGGISASGCDINVSFDNTQTGFAVCELEGSYIDWNNVRITSANIYMNSGFLWHFSGNRVPAPASDVGSVTRGGTMTTVNGGSTSLLANDTHPSSAPLSLSTAVFGGAEHGTVSLNSDGTFSYTHDGGSSASDFFVYRACMASDANACSLGMVSVAVTGATYTIGGTVSGLGGSGLVLQNNGVDNLAISSDGPFTFSTPLANSATYSVTLLTQPNNPDQICGISQASGTVSGKDVTDVSVNCLLITAAPVVTAPIVEGATSVSGTAEANAGVTVYVDGSSAGATTADGAGAWTVSGLAALNSGQQVTARATAAGKAQSSLSAAVMVLGRYTVGGTVSGLAGTGLVLQNNSVDDLPISADGDFTFATALVDLSSYNVTVRTHPSSPSQICLVNQGNGSLNGTDVIDVEVTCVDSCTYALTQPDGGENWVAGATYSINWGSSGSGCAATANIELYEGGTFVRTIANGTSDTAFAWSIPPNQPIGYAYQVRVVDSATSSFGAESAGDFIINDPYCNTHIAPAVIEYGTTTHQACDLLIVPPGFTGAAGATLRMAAGSDVVIEPGVSMETGASLEVNVCGQSLCEISTVPMPATCHPCIEQICALDADCCTSGFDQACVDQVDTVCRLVCE